MSTLDQVLKKVQAQGIELTEASQALLACTKQNTKKIRESMPGLMQLICGLPETDFRTVISAHDEDQTTALMCIALYMPEHLPPLLERMQQIGVQSFSVLMTHSDKHGNNVLTYLASVYAINDKTDFPSARAIMRNMVDFCKQLDTQSRITLLSQTNTQGKNALVANADGMQSSALFDLIKTIDPENQIKILDTPYLSMLFISMLLFNDKESFFPFFELLTRCFETTKLNELILKNIPSIQGLDEEKITTLFLLLFDTVSKLNQTSSLKSKSPIPIALDWPNIINTLDIKNKDKQKKLIKTIAKTILNSKECKDLIELQLASGKEVGALIPLINANDLNQFIMTQLKAQKNVDALIPWIAEASEVRTVDETVRVVLYGSDSKNQKDAMLFSKPEVALQIMRAIQEKNSGQLNLLVIEEPSVIEQCFKLMIRDSEEFTRRWLDVLLIHPLVQSHLTEWVDPLFQNKKPAERCALLKRFMQHDLGDLSRPACVLIQKYDLNTAFAQSFDTLPKLNTGKNQLNLLIKNAVSIPDFFSFFKFKSPLKDALQVQTKQLLTQYREAIKKKPASPEDREAIQELQKGFWLSSNPEIKKLLEECNPMPKDDIEPKPSKGMIQ